MAFQDKTLTCKECGKEFIFTAGEQEFYAEKGFENEPARCRDCRDKRRRSRELERLREYEEMLRAEEQTRKREELLRIKAEEIARAQDSGEMHANGQKSLRRRYDKIHAEEAKKAQTEKADKSNY